MNFQRRLFFGKPIPLNKDVSVIQPKVDDIVELGDEYEEYLSPFVLTMESLFDDKNIIDNFNLFDLFFEKNEEGNGYLLEGVFNGSPLDRICESINFFTGQEVTRVLENSRKLIIADSYIVDKNSFNELRSAIQAVACRQDVVVEKMPPNLSERRKDIWLKIQEGRRRKAQREALKLEDMANIISFGGKSYIPIEQILNMTYYSFINAYKSILEVDSYFVSLQYKVSQKYDYKDELAHWSKNLKIKTE